MNTKIINEVFNSLETGKFDVAGTKMSENFCTTLAGNKVNKTEYLHAYKSILQGIPNLKLDLKDVRTEGPIVKARLTISGTHVRPFPAIMNGWQDIAATGRTIDGLVSDIEIVLKNDKIEEIRNADVNKGMVVDLLGKLGLDYHKFQSN